MYATSDRSRENIPARNLEFGNFLVHLGNFVVNLGNFLYRILELIMLPTSGEIYADEDYDQQQSPYSIIKLLNMDL